MDTVLLDQEEDLELCVVESAHQGHFRAISWCHYMRDRTSLGVQRRWNLCRCRDHNDRVWCTRWWFYEDGDCLKRVCGTRLGNDLFCGATVCFDRLCTCGQARLSEGTGN
jgi:hypothetical protein